MGSLLLCHAVLLCYVGSVYLADAAKSKTFQTTPPTCGRRWRNRKERRKEGEEPERSGREREREGTLFIVRRMEGKDSRKKEGGIERANVFASHEIKTEGFWQYSYTPPQ